MLRDPAGYVVCRSPNRPAAPPRATDCLPLPSPEQTSWWRLSRTPSSPGRRAHSCRCFGRSAESFVGGSLASLIASSDHDALGLYAVRHDAARAYAPGRTAPERCRKHAMCPCGADFARTAAPALREARPTAIGSARQVRGRYSRPRSLPRKRWRRFAESRQRCSACWTSRDGTLRSTGQMAPLLACCEPQLARHLAALRVLERSSVRFPRGATAS